MRALIIGASKGIGLETTRQALDAGHHVRALARSAAAIAISNPNLEKIRGDALKTEDVEAALVGVDVVIQTLGVGLGDLFRPVHLFSDATRVLIAAMRDGGAVAELVGIEVGVVSGVINLESSGVEASDWRPRHDEHYHEV